ncbi:hypothetical protein ACMA1I_14325 [Pontibacter sp. 13R65]
MSIGHLPFSAAMLFAAKRQAYQVQVPQQLQEYKQDKAANNVKLL